MVDGDNTSLHIRNTSAIPRVLLALAAAACATVVPTELVLIHLHVLYLNEMAVSEAREHLATVIDSASRTGEPVYLTRRGKAVAVVVDPEVFERLLQDAEDALDRAELTIAREENGSVPWEQVKAKLGLT